MGGVQGINGLPPTPERPNDVRDRQKDSQGSKSAGDGVKISSEAVGAADGALLTQLTQAEPDIREDRVAEAKAALERGDHQLENRIAEVAKKLLEIL
jgi:anti-sigma28 factor (negative regulator of flagellin synthesis)